jgi:hypothetical protein
MNIREISDVFNDTADEITAIKSYNFGWASDRVRQGNTEDFQELNEFPRIFFSVPTITGSDQTRKQDTYQVTLFFDDLLGYDNEGDEDPTLQIDKWANLQQYANYFIQRLNKIKQSILPNYLFIPEAPSITFDSFTGIQRMITVQLSFNLVVPTNCDPGVITLVQCIANIVTSSNLTASLKSIIKFAASLEGRATVTADIALVKKVASSLNAFGTLTGDINFVQKVQASLLTSANVTGDISIPKLVQASLTGAGTTAADLTVGAPSVLVDYLVVAGGGGGGGGNVAYNSGGGGAGGYRCSVSGEISGGGASAESPLNVIKGTQYLVKVGTGGASLTNGTTSIFNSVTSQGGGNGNHNVDGSTGGSGGGGGATGPSATNGGSGTANQGYAGGAGVAIDPYPAGGGGGSAEAGNTDGLGSGGDGIFSSITGTSIQRGGGGSAARSGTSTTVIVGGDGGGGSGGRSSGATAPTAGEANKGAGGGGASGTGAGGNGGSGVVIISYSNTFSDLVTIHSSHVCNGQAAGGTTAPAPSTARTGYKTYIFTAGNGNISW